MEEVNVVSGMRKFEPLDLQTKGEKKIKPSIEEPPELELKLLSNHLKWRVCMDYRKLIAATKKDHFPLSFIDQMLDRLAGKEYYCFLDNYSGYNHITIAQEDQYETTYTCPYGTFAFHIMPFGLCNDPGTFQMCMMAIFLDFLAIFSDFLERSVEIFMDDFSVFGESVKEGLSSLEEVLKKYNERRLVLNWEKFHFMVKEGIVLGHKISNVGLKVVLAKINVVSKFPPPSDVKPLKSFLGHNGFYIRFIKRFS
ncbi:RNA-directed DNA polymerase-like protein [Cucumis melo var. makuwa]|uniref:RNA-directed DNA polymerase-like protein n=1 Tax=Cucumis melo var. makuwa TaxID=1194695 RepID=A0A5D3BV79_CUCMM|nr:RNA-directed DNA polymerase-like protein [Cucumis melo var. makuwa]